MPRPTLLLVALVTLPAAPAAAGLDPLLAATAAKAGFTEEQIQQSASHPQAVNYEPESEGRQITIIGLARISASPERITEDLLSRHGLLKSDALRQIGAFSHPPVPADVAKYRMPESDLETLVDCEVGDCKFKLGEDGAEFVQKIDWSAPDAYEQVNSEMKKGLLAVASRYQERGNAGLIVAVDKEEPQSFAEGSEQLATQLGLSQRLIPKLRAHLSQYPSAGIPGARDRIVWTVRDYGYRPVTSMLHSVVIRPEPGPPATVIALKTLYANHYIHARQQLIGLWADADDPSATWVGYSDRMLFDDDVGSIKRRMLAAGVVSDGRERLEVLRAQYE